MVVTLDADYNFSRYNGPTVGNPGRTCCDTGQMAKTARIELNKTGIDLDAFDHKIYAWPATAGELGASVAGVAALKSDWVGLWYLDAYTMTHELGHNLGMSHANFAGGIYIIYINILQIALQLR